MGKIIRKVIAVLLSVTAIILVLIPSSDAVATTQKGDFELSGSKLVSYSGTDSSVTLPNTITEIGSSAFEGNKNITKVVIPDSIKSIGYDAFRGCTNLNTVSIGNGVKKIDSEAFSGCINLSSINIPAKCESLGSGVFAGCNSLANVSIDSNNRFYVCLDGVIYSKNGTELVQYLPGRVLSTYSMPVSVGKIDEYAFWGADSLTAVSVSPGVKEIPEYAFSNCYSLNKVSLPSSVESLMAYSFADCPNLKSIYIPDSVGYIDEKAFYLTNGATIQFVSPDGSTKEEVKISDIDTEDDSNIAEDNDDEINNSNESETEGSKDYYFEDGYTPSYSGSNNWITKIKNRDFVDNKAPNELGSGMIVGGNAVFIMSSDMPVRGYNLDDAESEDAMAVSGGNTSLKNDTFNIINGVLAKYNGNDSNVSIIDNINRIGDRAFYKNRDIDNVQIPAGTKSIGEFAFARSGIDKVNIPDGVTDIGYAAFYHCEDLSDINIPSSVENIELGAFDGTKWLNDWKNIADGNDFLVVGDGILMGYKGEGGNISLPSNVKTIGPGCFEGNNNITGLIVHLGITRICEDAFNGCTKLNSVTLPDGLEVIEDRAFCDTNLSVVTIPDSVKEIGLGAFDTTGNMTPLKTVIFAGNDIPNVTYKDTATRMSAKNLRVDAFNGVENAIVQADSDLNSGTLMNPVNLGFHGQVYAISDDSTDNQGLLTLLKTNKKPDSSGNVVINSVIPIGKSDYMMNGVKEHAFDDYLRYYDWCDNKPVSVSVSGNASDNLNSLLREVNSKIDTSAVSGEGINVSIEGTSLSNSQDAYANIPEGDKGYLYIKEDERLKDDILSALYNYYGPNVEASILPLDISLFDKTNTINLHKLGDSKLEISMPLPYSFENKENIKVGSLDSNGSLTELPTEVSEGNNGKMLSFVANHCSTFAIYSKNDFIDNLTVEYTPSDNELIEDEIDSVKGNDPRNGRDDINENEVVEITSVINADTVNEQNNQNGVVKTLSRRIGYIQAKWYIIFGLFLTSIVLFIYKPGKNKYKK